MTEAKSWDGGGHNSLALPHRQEHMELFRINHWTAPAKAKSHPRQISECFAHVQTYTETYMYITDIHRQNFVNNTTYHALLKKSNQKPRRRELRNV